MNHKPKKNKALMLGAAAALLVVVVGLVVTAMLSGKTADKPAYAGGYPVHISEVMPYNSLIPNEEGVLSDWVEIVNTSDSDFDLSGYQLSDEAEKGKYTFPAGSVVPAGGYLVVWCDSTAEGNYARFALKRDGGESVYLMNRNGVVLDSAETVAAERNQTLVRGADGALTTSGEPTPGYANTAEGYAQWQAYMAHRSGGSLILSEVMSANSLYASPDGVYCDWVEIHNPTDYAISLEGYKLTDREGETKYELPGDVTLEAGGYYVVWCSKETEGYAPFGLAKDGGETLWLLNPGNTEADSLTLPVLEDNRSWALAADGSWIISQQATPGYANTQAGYEAYCLAHGAGNVTVAITEVAGRNNGILPDGDGEFSDWVELTNTGTETVDLTGWYLSDKEEEPNRWKLPTAVIQPGEQLLVFASGKNRSEGELHTDFSLSDGERIMLVTASGMIYAQAELGFLTDGCSLTLQSDGSYAETAFPTPGYPNNPEGYAAFSDSREAMGPLAIWEVMTANRSVNHQPDVGYSDWVELKNISDGPVELSDFTLTDSKNAPDQWALPEGVLQPGESVIYYCSGKTAYTADGFVHTNFSLSSGGEALYLYKKGAVCDGVFLHSIPSGGSMGRMDGENGFFYFTAPTPGGANGGGVRMIAQKPGVDTAPGVYDGVDSVTVALSGQGTVHYTTDGSTPTQSSPVYSEPLVLTSTSVIRAKSFVDGMLESETLTLSYIINEGHTLPVVSLVTDPEHLFGNKGIYDSHEIAWQEGWERPATVALFEQNGESFTIDCGISMHGQTSRRASGKRSIRLLFRGIYDGHLQYDVFDDGVVTDFGSLILRPSLEDTYTSYMRDILYAEIAMAGTSVPAQNYRCSILYINGEYWGIYAIRERISGDYFASHFGADPDTVDIQNGSFRYPGNWSEIMDYAEYTNMTIPENYETLKGLVNIPEIIEWLCIQNYSGNIDVYGNVRFIASPEYDNGRYMYTLTDLDLSMMNHHVYEVGFNKVAQFHGVIPVAVQRNTEFQEDYLTRLGEMLGRDLSRENVYRIIDELAATLQPEVARDTARWGYDANLFQTQIRNLKDYSYNRVQEVLNATVRYFDLNPEQIQHYFGHISE